MSFLGCGLMVSDFWHMIGGHTAHDIGGHFSLNMQAKSQVHVS